MKNINFKCYPGGARNVFTMSYDDGHVEDIRLIEILNKYGIKSTFNLVSQWVNNENFVGNLGRLNDIYQGHEIACHGLYHRSIVTLPKQSMVSEIWNDRLELEKMTGKIVRGMAYAYGDYNTVSQEVLSVCGMEYCRTTVNDTRFVFPKSFMEWTPTCHQREALERVGQFHEVVKNRSGRMFYVWGHSYEFDRNPEVFSWQDIEEFAKQISDIPDIWFATNIEIVEYCNAQKQLRFSADESIVYNPTSLTLYFTCDSEVVEIGPGETLFL